MARQKVKLAFIENKAKRQATYKKRLEGFMNKANELSTLCGISVCAIVYNMFDPRPMVWPSDLGAQQVISQFINMSEIDENKKMLNQETFLGHRIAKVNENFKKQEMENREKHITELVLQCLDEKETIRNLFQPDLDDVGSKIEEKLTEIRKRMEVLRGVTTTQQVSNPLPDPLIPSVMQQVATPLSEPQMPDWLPEHDHSPEWFMDLVN